MTRRTRRALATLRGVGIVAAETLLVVALVIVLGVGVAALTVWDDLVEIIGWIPL